MKEFPLAMREYLTNGLRPDARTPVDTPFMELLYNLKPNIEGLLAIDIPNPAIASVHTEQAATRLLVGESQAIVMDTIGGDMVAKIMDLSDRTLGTDLLTSGAIPDMNDDTGTITLTTGSRYQFVEKDGVWFITNGSALLTNALLGYTETWNGANKATSAIPTGMTVYNDRLVLCGIKSDLSGIFTGGTAGDLDTLWTNVWDIQRKFKDARGITQRDEEFDASYVVVGPPSGGSADLPFFMEQMLMSGYQAANHGYVLQAAAHGEIMFVKVPWHGEAIAVAPLGDNLIVYGDTGVGIIRPISGDTTQAQIPVQYFTVEPLLDIGILNESAFVGDKSQQTFIDTRGDVYRINVEGGITKLGYQEYISPLTDASVLMSFDQRENDIYISDGSDSYILTPQGLAKSRFTFNDILPYNDGSFYGVWVTDGGDTSSFKTIPLTMKTRQLKFTGDVSFEMSAGFTSPQAAYDHKTGNGSSYTSATLLNFNPDNEMVPALQGTDLKLKFSSGAVAANTAIHDINIIYKVTSHRRMNTIIS